MMTASGDAKPITKGEAMNDPHADAQPEPVPAVVPDVEGTWKALWAELPGNGSPTRAWATIEKHRPLIEAAIRAPAVVPETYGLRSSFREGRSLPSDGVSGKRKVASAVVPEWNGPSTEADGAEDHGDGYLVVPAVVPDVEAALRRALDECRQHHADTLAGKSPEGDHRAEGRGALDVEALRAAHQTVIHSSGPYGWEAVAAEYEALLAQREPAESQG